MKDGNSTQTRSAAGRIGYVLKVFPRVSETFVINEIRAVRSLGQDVSIFSLHHPKEAVEHEIFKSLDCDITYIEDLASDEEIVARTRRELQSHFGLSRPDRDRYLPRKYVRLALGLAESAKQAGVGHLHAHFASRAGHVSALAAAICGIQYSITAHAKDIYHEEVDQDLLRWKIEHSKFVATVTDFNLQYLRNLTKDRPKANDALVRIYNGVDLDRFSETELPEWTADPIRRDATAPVVTDSAADAGAPLILAVGRLVEKKGFGVLIDACGLLRARGVPFRCEIFGGGDEYQRLQDRIEAQRLEDCVRLRGSMSTEDVEKRIRDCAVSVLPCIIAEDGNVDALPTVLLEATASGRPLISTRVSGIPEIVSDEVNGLLVDPGDVEQLADAVEKILRDRELAVKMGRAGRARAEELFDLRKNAGTVLELMLAAPTENRIRSNAETTTAPA